MAGRHSCRLTRTPGGNRAVNRDDCSSRFRRRRVMVRPRARALKKCEPLPSGRFLPMLYAASGGRALSIHMIPSKSTIVELDMGELEEILRRVEAKQLQADDYQTIRELIESYVGLTLAVGDKSTTIRRLRQMLFGATTEKTATVVGAPLARDEKQAVSPASFGVEAGATPVAEGDAKAALEPIVGAAARTTARAIPKRRPQATAAMEPTTTWAPRRSTCRTRRFRPAIPARNAKRARSTRRADRAWWCG